MIVCHKGGFEMVRVGVDGHTRSGESQPELGLVGGGHYHYSQKAGV